MNDFNLREYLKNNPLLKEDVNIVKGFKEFEVDDEPDTEEDFEVRSFGAPMEGWDEEHYDYINIFSTATSDPDTGEELKPRYYVDVYVSYGDWTKDRTYYDTEEEAYGEVEYIMNDFKEDWEDIDDEIYGESKTLNENIEFIDYVTVDQDKFKAQYDKHYDDYGDDEEFIEEFGGDFLSPNIDAINQYYGAKVYADDVIDDFFMAGGKNNISSNEKFEAWLDKNREFYL